MSKELERYLYYPEMSPRRTISVGYLKILSLILVLMSVVGVFFAAQTSPAPLYRTRDLIGNFFLNYATVMIEGRIIEPIRLDVQSGGRIRLTMYLLEEGVEGSEPFTVFVYDPVASEFLTSRNYVDFGDMVRLLVQVRVREDFTYGILQDPSHVLVINKTTLAEPINVTSLSSIDQYAFVCAEGIVSNPGNVSTGLLFDLLTTGEKIKVLIPHTFRYRFVNAEGFDKIWESINTAGSILRICGPVYYYRGTSPEIVVLRIQDIVVKEALEVYEVDFTELAQYINRTVAVSGIFNRIGYDSTTRLYLIYLNDEEGNFVVVNAPRELVNVTIDPWRVGLGSRLRIVGTVVSPSSMNALQIEAVEINLPINTTRVSDVLNQPHGSIVILWGIKVISSSTTSGGNWIIDVADETGTLRVFVPASVARGIGTSPPPVSSIIAVAGYRDIYGQYEEIVVYSENGLIRVAPITTPQPPPGPPTVKIGDLGKYLNQEVSIVGELLAIRYNSSDRLYYVELQDNTGRANATMTRDLVVSIDPWNAGPGTTIKVNGTVRSNVLISAKGVEAVSSTPTPNLTVKEALLKPHGTLVAIVNARVTSSRTTSGNDWQITITDNSGASILIFIPRSVVADIGLSLPSAGSIISIAGYRDVYAGTEEIVVYSKFGYRQEE